MLYEVITAQVAGECGLAVGTKVVIGGGDGMCASVGAGSISEGKTYNCLGSSSWICTTTKKPIFDDEMRTFNWAHIVPGYIGVITSYSIHYTKLYDIRY